MDQLPSNSIAFRGLLRSGHALLVLLAIVLIALFGLALSGGFLFGQYVASIGLSAILVCVLFRYTTKGPEADRAQPAISVTQQDNRVHAQFVNVEMTHEVIAILHAIQSRRPLPPPDAVVEGSVTDPHSFKPLSPEMAASLQKQDAEIRASPLARSALASADLAE
jgi:hypothetical protein